MFKSGKEKEVRGGGFVHSKRVLLTQNNISIWNLRDSENRQRGSLVRYVKNSQDHSMDDIHPHRKKSLKYRREPQILHKTALMCLSDMKDSPLFC